MKGASIFFEDNGHSEKENARGRKAVDIVVLYLFAALLFDAIYKIVTTEIIYSSSFLILAIGYIIYFFSHFILRKVHSK
ncbi:hypothetical protein [Sinobaca sp. H24]|uniref:hypothetical protein n=1 Tax=Sinobaca sp. H24 TaxID=2923376 RepID=UPI002079733A|nr:hypothetical protein [Sinobaca sp. H24]